MQKKTSIIYHQLKSGSNSKPVYLEDEQISSI